MRHFLIEHFGLTGILRAPLGDLESPHLSCAEQGMVVGLDDVYEWNGLDADYQPGGGSLVAVKVIKVQQRLQLEVEGERRIQREMLEVRGRRYNGFPLPALQDQLWLDSGQGIRRYLLTAEPVGGDNQLEWVMEFSRTLKHASGVGGVRYTG